MKNKENSFAPKRELKSIPTCQQELMERGSILPTYF